LPILHRRAVVASAYFQRFKVLFFQRFKSRGSSAWRGLKERGDRQMRYFKSQRKAGFFRRQLCVGATATLLALSPQIARADESGVSF